MLFDVFLKILKTILCDFFEFFFRKFEIIQEVPENLLICQKHIGTK